MYHSIIVIFGILKTSKTKQNYDFINYGHYFCLNIVRISIRKGFQNLTF